MPFWLIPMAYTAVSIVCALIVPRIEYMYSGHWVTGASVGSALAFFSSVTSGMMALTGIVFTIAFVIVQFAAFAYSPRVVILLARNPAVFHAMGIFFATFIYSLAALVWTDREGSGHVPWFSAMIVQVLLIASLFAFAKLVQSLSTLQIHNVLRFIGGQGRAVIGTMFERLPAGRSGAAADADQGVPDPGPVAQTLSYVGEPLAITRFDVGALVRLAERANAVIMTECAVGDTVIEGTVLLTVHGAAWPLPQRDLRAAIRLGPARTFEQDPKYAIRLLVDIAIRALSPAVNDPTTAVQALDQIEDLLRRLGRRELDAGRAYDRAGTLRLIFPTPSWDDYLSIAFDEIRHYGATSVQVVRRLRSVLVGLAETVASVERQDAVRGYLDHLNAAVGRTTFYDAQDQLAAAAEDRQGLGLTRKRPLVKAPDGVLTP